MEHNIPKNIKSQKIAFYKHKDFKKNLFVYAVLFLPLSFYIVFNLFPNVLSVVYSFFNWDGLREPIFIGLDNYTKLLMDEFFYRAIKNNLIIMIIVPAVTVCIALWLSYFLTSRRGRMSKVYQVVFFLPNILSSVVIALLWAFIYDGDFGLLNGFLSLFGIDTGDLYWLANEKTALWAVLPVYIWANVGFYTVIFSNAIKSIPESYYEYATLEGATGMQKLKYIVVPMIMNILKVSFLFLVLMTFKSYDIIMILTGGGPNGATDVVGRYMFGMAFNTGGGAQASANYGYASTIGMALFVILIIAKYIIDKVTGKSDLEF